MRRLKRLIAKNNNIKTFSNHLADAITLIEVDFEGNQVDSCNEVLLTVQNKADLLVFNLKLNPLTATISNYD